MATKPAKASDTDVEELLDTVDKTLDRLKTLYEQYFLGIQKQAPSFIHNDVERKLRDLTQMNLRNTGVRYRLATLTQKFGSYNSYWRRTLRQIENGTYTRQLQKLGRDAIARGTDVPEEILAAMPKRMREQVMRDREAALAQAKRRQAAAAEARAGELGGDQLPPEADADFIAMIKEPTEVRRKLKGTDGSHLLSDAEADFDIDAFFAEVEQQGDAKPERRSSGITTPPRTKSPTNAPRARSTTRNDLVRQGTAPPPIKTPTQGMPPLQAPGRAAPPPIPGRATASQPAISRPATLTDDDTPTGNHAPLDPDGGAPLRPQPRAGTAVPPPSPGRATGAQPILDPRTGLPFGQVPLDPATGRPLRAATVPGTGAQPPLARPPVAPPSSMASQSSRPNPIAPGAAAAKGAVPVESLQGPFPRAKLATPSTAIPAIPKPGTIPPPPKVPEPPSLRPRTPAIGMPAISNPFASVPAVPRPIVPTSAETQPMPTVTRPPAQPDEDVVVTRTPATGAARPAMRTPAQGVPAIKPGMGARPPAAAPQKPPPGMTDADVNALYAKYVKAKEMVGEKIGPGEQSKLLKTINAQAPKIMEQYKAKGVDFSVVVKDNQVIIRAKPKT